MPVTASSPAPYAPAKAVLGVIDRYRRNLPSPLTDDVLRRSGISDSLISRTLQALQSLDLIDENYAATPTLERLRRAPEPEFQQHLVEWLNAAYADVLNFTDPATATESAILDAFRSYNPVGQRPRMVSLFTGLYTAAGVRTTDRALRSSRSVRTQKRVLNQSRQRTTMPVPRPEHEVSPNVVQRPRNGIGHTELVGQLVSKFPTFDPTWPDEIKAKWFTGFQQFMDVAKSHGKE